MTNITLNLTRHWFVSLGTQLFGSTALTGLFALSMLVVLLARNRATMEFYVMIGIPFVFVLSSTSVGFLPSQLQPILGIGLALTTFVAAHRYIFGR